MEIALYANTHGLAYRDDTDVFLANTPLEHMQPVRVAQWIEQAGFHSLWFPDHVCMPMTSSSFHTANASGKRAYQDHHNMMDAAVTMGAVAATTSRIKLAPSCLIAPYRNPLSDARQFMTVDQLSGGRVMLGVASGWMTEEYDAVGIDYAERNQRTKECIEIYRAAWRDEAVSYDGAHYRFDNISMDPKPAQSGGPLIAYGGNSPFGARRAIRLCDALYPLFLDSHAEPDRFAPLQDIIRREAEKIGRDVTQFSMFCASSAHIVDADHAASRANPRRICTGTAEQILSDLHRFAAAGYSMVVCMMECASNTLVELEEQIQRFGEEVIPEAKGIKPAGEWKVID